MWIVRLALQRPYTFIVVALLIVLISPLVIFRTSTDIFPNINIPVISVVWDYEGLSPDDMANRITSNFERALTTTVNDISHIESQSMHGRSVVKVFFHQSAHVDVALSQVTAIAQTLLRSLPQGSQPPLIITYNASSVPVLQLGMSSDKLGEQEINDLSMNFIRTQLITVPGAGVPYPYGGKMRQVMVDIDLYKLRSKGLTPSDVVNAISAENLILPGGTVKIGGTEYDVNLNGSTQTTAELNKLPIKMVNGSIIYIGDVAHVRDGFKDQTNVVRQDGKRAVLLSVVKTGANSTLDIVDGILGMLPRLRKQVPPELKITPLFNQSIFVRAAISGVVKEALIAACLTAIMILLFLADWRATIIICISIPLSILCSICALSALGETINLMTLGGLALAVGILVDDATVEIENIERQLRTGKELKEAILAGAAQIAVPAFVATICICIVFIPMFLLSGVARYLFVPLAEAVIFAMLASYFWSRTLVPTLAMYWLRDHAHAEKQRTAATGFIGFCVRFQRGFENMFRKIRDSYAASLNAILHHPKVFVTAFLCVCGASMLMIPFLGEDFFPKVDAGQIRLHMRAKTGTRIEETARICDEVENKIRQIIPARDLDSMLDNIGVPYSGINTSYSNNGTFGTSDAEILISLKKDHQPTEYYVKELRAVLPKDFPGNAFFFQPADIVSQILNFGLPAPIDVQILGRDVAKNFEVASKLLEELRKIPGIADVHLQQAFDQPKLNIDVDRSKSAELSLTHRQVADSMLISLSGSGQTTPTFWLNPKNGVVYSLTTKVPQYHIESLQDLQNLPIHSNDVTKPNQLLANLATITRGIGAGVVSHYNVTPCLDIYATTQGRPLGSVARDVRKAMAKAEQELPRGSTISILGQVETMRSSFLGLGLGVIGAIVLVYLLIVVNFQSWTDPFIIITALPGALTGIIWLLFLTGTTINVPSLMGSVMCVGVATANSILVVSFATEVYKKTGNGIEAARQAGYTRLRPVIMTALAMIIGMVPMALGLGEGGEQNAPLARAVIGGLLAATVATLFFVPVIFSIFRKNITPSDENKSEVETTHNLPPLENAHG
ncbi:MAG: efflux RND transporter permease subunit, partial [Chthoniobacterales bacterium]